MNYDKATIILTAAVAVNLRKLSQMLGRADTDGMFTTALSSTGALPATHYISSGYVPQSYLAALSTPAKLKAAADKAYAEEDTVQPFSLVQITAALSKCTVSDGTRVVDVAGIPTVVAEGPHELIARLGLQLINSTAP